MFSSKTRRTSVIRNKNRGRFIDPQCKRGRSGGRRIFFFLAHSHTRRWFEKNEKKKKTKSVYRLCNDTIGSLSNDDGDGNKNGKKAIGLISKTTTLHVHHAFLYISLPSSHEHNVEVPNFKFCRGRENDLVNFSSQNWRGKCSFPGCRFFENRPKT